jgi:hypothetical protein
LILGGAAVYRCDNRFVLIPALAAEAAALGQKRLFQQTVPAAGGTPRWKETLVSYQGIALAIPQALLNQSPL